MRSIKRMMAVAMLAMIATMGSQSVMANSGVLLSDRDGVLLSDREGVLLSDKTNIKSADQTDIIMVIVNGITGVLLSD